MNKENFQPSNEFHSNIRHTFFIKYCLFYRIEKIERLGRTDALGERDSYGGYASSFDVVVP